MMPDLMTPEYFFFTYLLPLMQTALLAGILVALVWRRPRRG